MAPGDAALEIIRFHRVPGVPAGAVHRPGVVYGRAGSSGRDLHLWLFSRADVSERRPGVAFVHSGGWFQGSPVVHLRHAWELARRGFVTATIEYRLHPEGTVHESLADTKCAVRWLRSHAGSIGLDPGRLVIAGGSAGGHLASMTALTPGQWEGEGGDQECSSEVSAVVMWYPMVDLHLCTGILAQTVPRIVGPDPAALSALSPVNHVHPGAPPMLTITGDRDTLTPVEMVRQFHAALDTAGVPNQLVVLAGREHGFDTAPTDWQAAFDPVLPFLDGAVGTAAHPL